MILPSKLTSKKFKTRILVLAFLPPFYILAGFTNPVSTQSKTGEGLYKKNCVRCHGADGTRGFLGAKDLKKSMLADSAVVVQIQNGKGFMPAFKKKFSVQELADLVGYIKGLRNK